MKYIANPVEVDAYEIVAVFGDPREGDIPASASKTGLDLKLRGELGHVESRHVDPAMCSRYIPQIGDYYVMQADGYVYLNPKDVFERKYRLAE